MRKKYKLDSKIQKIIFGVLYEKFCNMYGRMILAILYIMTIYMCNSNNCFSNFLFKTKTRKYTFTTQYHNLADITIGKYTFFYLK